MGNDSCRSGSREAITLWKGVILLPFAILLAEDAGAQANGLTRRVVSGRVIDSVSGRPLARAVLYFADGAREFRAGTDGRFRIEDVSLTDTILTLRQIGYVPGRVLIPLSPSAAEVDVGTVRLRPVATELDRIAVEVEEVRRFPRLEGFYGRKQLGLAGFFLTPEDIARASARKTSGLLERTVKVATECNNTGSWQKSRGGGGSPSDCVARNRRPQGASQFRVESCEFDVWIDGQKTLASVDDVSVYDIAAIEVYSGPATTPAVFGGGHCGAIVIWTRN